MARPGIRRLDAVTIARIAAGEVIERPASVVKELIENSLDAGATRIQVELLEGGIRLIRVTDDGHGIADAEQLRLAFEQHATSKLAAAEDLDAVGTLGFRGEALASIAAVSQVTAISKSPEGQGHRLRIDNGKLVDLAPVGAGPGTSVTVENLFNALPARRKFLRQPSTEAAQVQDLVARYALAFPALAFELRVDGRESLRSGGGSIDGALRAVLGSEAAAALLPAEDLREDLAPPSGPLRVEGFVSPQHVHRASRRYVILMVNGRPIQDARLNHAVLAAYQGLIPKGRYPLVLLRVTLPPAAVDVNVHPAKAEVRFRDDRAVYAAVQRAVRVALAGRLPIAPAADAGFGSPGLRGAWPPAPSPRHPAAGPWSPGKISPPSTSTLGIGERSALAYPAGGTPPQSPVALPALRLLGQLSQAYLVAEGPDGLYLVDQHAAHERVMYERLLDRSGPLQSQPLLAPEAVSVGPAAVDWVQVQGEGLADLGIVVEPFGPDSLLLRALPEVLARAGDPVGLLRDLLDLAMEGGRPTQEAVADRVLRAVCKRASVKAGQLLQPAEMRRLLEDLEACRQPRTCPHGRPTVIALSRGRIDQLFGR